MSTLRPSTISTRKLKFTVNGSAIPEVNFDAGESYAGQLPIGGDSDGKLYFWFWPTTNPDQPKEILIWLNGGPGCSSLEGFLQENGPIQWQSGTYKPVANPWSYHHITNVVWIEQPVGTGFSTGTVTAHNEDEVAQQFMGFWKNFIDTFSMQGYKVYVTGESYAGMYVPYISSNMLDANDTTNFNVKGMHIYDPSIVDYMVATTIPTNYFVQSWSNVFPFNDTTKAQLSNISATCGFDDYMDKYLTFPPAGPQPGLPAGYHANGSRIRGCGADDLVYYASTELNPGWNIYQVTQLLPLPEDVLGFPYSDFYTPPGLEIYFNRTDVKKAINAPLDVDWAICADDDVFVDGNDDSDPSSWRVIPSVIDRTQNVMISHGLNDFVLVANGTLLAIQNMTWGGKLGFQERPSSPLFVPHHPNPDLATTSGQGVLGTTHSERGLTWSLVTLTGHMVPSWQPAVAYRQVEFLLGRVDSLSSTKPLSNYANATQPSADSLGLGVGPVLGAVANATSGGANESATGGAGPVSTNAAPSMKPSVMILSAIVCVVLAI
ncbi:serine carboxypeptidase [Coniochaeta sp. 2T2.1]|nr:serine carboxypeptidase [Coniochaeta sp. 2T2.1]